MKNSKKWPVSPLDILQTGPVVPVIVINKSEHAVPLARALVKGGIKILEITLRSNIALEAIANISREVPEAIVGAGTVLSARDLQAVADAGGQFAISPGLTPSLLAAANEGPIGLIPGISSASELMLGMEQGYTVFKFFPAAAAGGIKMLKSIGGPFPQITFCPTGGISPENFLDYLQLPNVACVGGSWLVPSKIIAAQDWPEITQIARQTLSRVT
ncbi:MAG: keto-deoxy-phosphogluconate aldolase [Desulfobulbus sp.]|nr:MAG: keto-deoxy-phosphogluconate aldolase [Desulfobulbus sp.]